MTKQKKSRLIHMRLPDERKGIVTFDVAVQADDEMNAVGKLADYLTELKATVFYPQPLPVSASSDLRVVGQELIRRLKAISDPIAFILTLHLFTEHLLNQILKKSCPGYSLKGR